MFKILEIEKKNNIYNVHIYVEIDSNNLNNIGIKGYFKNILFNENTNNIKIDNSIFPLSKIPNTFSNSIDYVKETFYKNKEFIQKIVVGTILAVSLSTNAFAGSLYTYNVDSTQQYNITMQQNIGTNYAPIIEDMKNKIVNEFLERYGDKVSKDITKQQILDNFVIQLSNHINTNDTYSINLENVENKDKYLENSLAIQSLSKNAIMGDLDKVNIVKNNGYISINLSLDLLNGLINNSNDKEYVDSFNSMLSNLSIHELTHKYLHYNEIGAVDSQIHKITSEKFKQDVLKSSLVNQENNQTATDYQKYFKTIINVDGMNTFFSDISQEDDIAYTQAYQNVKDKILNINEINKYLINDISYQNNILYLIGDRNVDDTKYVALNEYANAVLGDKIFSTDNIGFFDKKKVDPLYQEILDVNVDFSGGIFFNAMVNLADSDANEKEVEIFNKLLSKHLFEMKMGISYIDNLENHKIIFNSIYEKMNDMYDKAKDHSIKFSKDLESQTNNNSLKNL